MVLSRFLTTVIPVFNDFESLQVLLAKIETVDDPKLSFLIVENGSTDNTWLWIEQYLEEYPKPNIRIARSKKGLGNAIREGINLASGSYVVFMEDDLPFGLQELTLARQRVLIHDNKWNIISKYHSHSVGITYRRIQGWGFIALRELILNLKVRDSQGTFFAEAALTKKISQLSSEEGFLITTEFIAIARRLNVEITQIPCGSVFVSARKTTIGILDVGRMFIGLFRLRLKMGKLKYRE